jgi:hypothetical protein
MKGWGVVTKFGTEVDIGERPVGGKLDIIELVGVEESDKIGGVVIKGIL